VAAALLALATVVAVALSARTYPATLAAALELDARFGLKERVTAAVELPPEQCETPVGRAVVADAERPAGELRVGGECPGRSRRCGPTSTGSKSARRRTPPASSGWRT